jgi:hypothetical protein
MNRLGISRIIRWPTLTLRNPARHRRFVSSKPNLPPNQPQSRLTQYIPRLESISTKSGLPLPSLALSFAILHELTAIVPLIALFFAFQAFGVGASVIQWTSRQEDADDLGFGYYIRDWLREGQQKVDKVARRYGFFGYEKGSKASVEQDQMSPEDQALQAAAAAKQSTAAAGVANAIAAYVVVKVSHAASSPTRYHVLKDQEKTGCFATTHRSIDWTRSEIHAIRSRTT